MTRPLAKKTILARRARVLAAAIASAAIAGAAAAGCDDSLEGPSHPAVFPDTGADAADGGDEAAIDSSPDGGTD